MATESWKRWNGAGPEIKDIHMAIVPKGCMRPQYQDGWGDYWIDEKGVLQIRAVEMPDLMYSHYILLHEYLEAVRCIRDGISLESIERFDALHSDHDDPGTLPDAPYRAQHMASMMLEMVACLQDGYTWDEYDNAEPV
jgi:hypothetical protein